MAECIGTGFPQFPCALMQIRYSMEENSCDHILMGGNSGGKEGKWLAVGEEVTGDKKRKEEKRGKRWRRCIRQVAIQVNTNREKNFILW